jgi:hypothetical protein
MDDVESDHRCLAHLQNALKELILALNMEPDSYEIAQAVMAIQCAVSCMRSEVRYQMPDDDEYETPPVTEAAQLTLQEAARYFNDDERKRLAKTGHAMKDGSFPITNRTDLKNAIHLAGHASNPAAAKAHIKRMAAKLGAAEMIPKDWAAELDPAATDFLKSIR